MQDSLFIKKGKKGPLKSEPFLYCPKGASLALVGSLDLASLLADLLRLSICANNATKASNLR